MPELPSVQEFQDIVAAYLRDAEVSPSAFGRQVCGNPHFVGRLMGNSQGPRLLTVHKALRIVNDWRAEQEALE